MCASSMVVMLHACSLDCLLVTERTCENWLSFTTANKLWSECSAVRYMTVISEWSPLSPIQITKGGAARATGKLRLGDRILEVIFGTPQRLSPQ